MLNSYCISSHNHVYVMYIIARWEVPRKSNFDSHPCDFFPLSQQSAFLMHFFGNSQSARPPGYWRPAVPSPPMLRTASRQGGHGAGAADAASGRGPNVPQLPFPTHFWLSLRRGAQQSQKQINAISLMSAFIWKNSPPLQAVCYFDPIFHFLFEGKWGLTLQLDDALLAGAKKSAVNPKGRLVCAVIITQNCSLRHMIWGRTAFCGIFAHVLLYWHFTSSIFARS